MRTGILTAAAGDEIAWDVLPRFERIRPRTEYALGMGHDGGYYLIGMNRLHPELFQDIAWSTKQVILQTVAVCVSLGLTVHQLPEWYDVDVAADLDRLRQDLAQDPALAPHTYDFFKRRDEV